LGRNPFLDFLAALLPAAERDELYRRHGADPAVWSFLLGLLELFLGVRWLLASALSWSQAAANGMADHVLNRMDPRLLDSFENRLAIMEGGAVIWLTWALRPATWLLASIPVVGVARLVAFAVSRDAVGEPVVWLAVRMARGVRRLVGAVEDRRRFGPPRLDRVLCDPSGDLVVLSCRPKAEWNERITLAIGERFYRVQRVEERPDCGWQAHAYLLQEAPPNEVFRGLIRYEPPGTDPPPSLRSLRAISPNNRKQEAELEKLQKQQAAAKAKEAEVLQKEADLNAKRTAAAQAS
jgi:hypothetical protein